MFSIMFSKIDATKHSGCQALNGNPILSLVLVISLIDAETPSKVGIVCYGFRHFDGIRG